MSKKRNTKNRRDRDESDRVWPDGFCSTVGKDYFRTEETAELALVAARRRGPGRGGKLETRFYLCPWCHGFHLSSKPRPEGA